MNRNAQALVIGGGPVGLFAALALQKRGVSVQVLDATGERAVRGHACGLHAESLRLFDSVGLMPALLDAGHRVDRLVLWRAGEKAGSADFAALPGAYPFVVTLGQSELEELLEEALASRGVPVARHHAVTRIVARDRCVRVAGRRTREPPPKAPSQHVAVEPIEHEADFVIGADGFFSSCRRALELEAMPMLPTRVFAVCEFLADLGAWEHEAFVASSRDSLSAFWPLGATRGRWTFQVDGRLDEAPSLESLRAQLAERAPWFKPRPEQLCWGAVVPFQHSLVPRFGHERIWLVGDAAHSTSPIGFQSMNRGFSEASALAQLIASALHATEHQASVFERFERDQQAEWQRLFGLGAVPAGQRGLGPELTPCLPASGGDFEALVAQLSSRATPANPLMLSLSSS